MMDGHARSQTDETLMLDEAVEAPPIVRFDERRMHIRAYNYWASLLRDGDLPSIEDLNPVEIEDFGSHSVLLDFTSGIDNPSIAFMGSALADQCDVRTSIDRVSEIPARTLLSRLTDHYLQIIANAAPIGFEAEFTNQRGNDILYRGIMMPFSSSGDTIDFVYGVINWKEIVSDAIAETIAAEVFAQPISAPTLPTGPLWANDIGDDHPIADDIEDEDELALSLAERIDDTDEATTLDDRLATAREAAAAATASEGRTRHALYRAIGLAHGFALAARARPEDYSALLAESGLVAQPRSPMTALVKLVFGASYDKTRLAEFVCAIDHALAHDLAPGALTEQLHALPGGLKALVADVRAAKRGEARASKPTAAQNRARKALAQAIPLAPGMLRTDETGLAVVILRRDADGVLVPVATLDGDDRLAGRVIAAAAKRL